MPNTTKLVKLFKTALHDLTAKSLNSLHSALKESKLNPEQQANFYKEILIQVQKKIELYPALNKAEFLQQITLLDIHKDPESSISMIVSRPKLQLVLLLDIIRTTSLQLAPQELSGKPAVYETPTISLYELFKEREQQIGTATRHKTPRQIPYLKLADMILAAARGDNILISDATLPHTQLINLLQDTTPLSEKRTLIDTINLGLNAAIPSLGIRVEQNSDSKGTNYVLTDGKSKFEIFPEDNEFLPFFGLLQDYVSAYQATGPQTSSEDLSAIVSKRNASPPSKGPEIPSIKRPNTEIEAPALGVKLKGPDGKSYTYV